VRLAVTSDSPNWRQVGVLIPNYPEHCPLAGCIPSLLFQPYWLHHKTLLKYCRNGD